MQAARKDTPAYPCYAFRRSTRAQLARLVCGCVRRITILRYATVLTRASQSDQPSRPRLIAPQATPVEASSHLRVRTKPLE